LPSELLERIRNGRSEKLIDFLGSKSINNPFIRPSIDLKVGNILFVEFL